MRIASGRNRPRVQTGGAPMVHVKRARIFGLLFLVLATGLTTTLAGTLFYIFKDDQGRTRMHDTIPPEYAQKGYRVVNERGVTIKVVPPVEKSRRPVERRLTDQDRALLDTFQNVDDIAMARDRQIEALEGIIRSTGSNMEAYRRNLQKLEAQAARIEKEGQPLSDKLLADMEFMRHQIKTNEAFIEKKRREQEETRRRYDRDIRRFRELEEVSRN